MCDVIVMSSRINKLSKSGFNNRLKLTTQNEIANIRIYNRQIEKLVDDTYNVFNEIGEDEWGVLKEPLEILISTTKDLLKAYRKKFKNHEECENLDSVLADLIELRSDIYNFRILLVQDKEIGDMLNRISNTMHSKAS